MSYAHALKTVGQQQKAELELNRQIEILTPICYELLKNGRKARVDVKPQYLKLLGRSFLDLGMDPWGHQYQFMVGPLEQLDTGDGPSLISYRRSWKDGADNLKALVCGQSHSCLDRNPLIPQTIHEYSSQIMKC